MNRLHFRGRVLDRRGLLAAGGLVALGAATSSAALASVDDDSRKLSPTDRTAVPTDNYRPYEVRVIYRTAPPQPLVALTFDDGPTHKWTPLALDLLAHHNAKATFFVVGQHLAAAPELGAAAARAGHQIGNHTWAHSDLTTHKEAFIRNSVRRTHQLITEVTGDAPTVLRPPWGRIDSLGLLACSELAYDVVLWAEHVTGSNAAADAATTLRHATPGAIVLAHDGGSEPNATLMQALDRLLSSLRSKGFQLVTVAELLRPPALARRTPR